MDSERLCEQMATNVVFEFGGAVPMDSDPPEAHRDQG